MTTQDKVVLPRESDDGFAHFTFDRESKFIRFYLWLWEANARDINTCKLFWAYVFAPLALLVKGVAAAVGGVYDLFPHKPQFEKDAAYLERRAEARKRYEAKKAAGPSRLERALNKVSVFFSAAYVKVSPVLKWGGITIGVLLALAAVAALVLLVVTKPVAVLLGLAVAAAAGLLLVLIGAGIAWLDARSVKKGEVPFFSTMGRLFKSFHRHTCAKINLN